METMTQLLWPPVEGFFAAVSLCALLTWFYNKFVGGLRESYIKKAGSLSILPLSILAGVGHTIAVYTDNPHSKLVLLTGIPITLFAMLGWIREKKLNAQNKRSPIPLKRDGIHYEKYPFPIAQGLRLIAPINRAGRPEWLEKSVYLRGLHQDLDGYTIIFLTDFHVHPTHRDGYYRELIDVALSQPSDAIFIGGDFVSRSWNRKKSATLLGRLKEHPCLYAVRGNHDFWTRPSFFEEMLKGWGARLLKNEWAVIEKGEGKLALLGLEDPYLPLTKTKKRLLREQLKTFNEQYGPLAVIGLIHTPEIYKEAQQLGCQFAMAGHTHGGQIRLPLFGTTVASSTMAREYVFGSGEFKGMETLTSTGIGCFFPVRLLCPPQLIKITLRKA